MAQYKVPQDVEAEDKFVGPFTFKQFLFAGATAITGYLSFLTLTSPLPFLVVLFVPFFLVSLAFTIPWSKDQPTELFLASRIRFLFMKRKRIWDQSGVKDLVTITVPKREVHFYTDGLSQDQVRDRMSALSNVIDSRGWAVKNAPRGPRDDTDRLVAPAAPIKTAEELDAQRAPDLLDETSSRAQQVDQMIQKSENDHRREALDLVASARNATKRTKDAPAVSSNDSTDTLIGGISLPQVAPQHAAMKQKQPPKQKPLAKSLTHDDEEKMLSKLHQKQAMEEEINSHSHLKKISPLGSQKSQQTSAQKSAASDDDDQSTDNSQNSPQTSGSPTANPDILNLSQNDDRSVASLAREASHQKPDDGEVVISLH